MSETIERRGPGRPPLVRPQPSEAQPEQDRPAAPRAMFEAEEVERIVADRVEQATRAVADEFAQKLAAFEQRMTPGVAAGLSDNAAMEALAMAIAGVTDQEIGRRRIAPEELAKRIRAREQMEALIQKTIHAGVQPTYNLTQKQYMGERIIEPFWIDRATKVTHPTNVGWWIEPNEFMVPTNDEARAIHALFLESIGGGANKRAPNLRVTVGGLTVRSGGLDPSGGRSEAPQVGRDRHEATIRGQQGQTPEVLTRILGTLMPPARQAV